jgi:predicted nucleotidyltransferase component of viral defense system
VDLNEIRRITIIALFADDKLMDQIVLKGGNALSLIHGLSSRTSVDLDFSIDEDFDDVEDVKQRIFRSLKGRFEAKGYTVFDERFEAKPRIYGTDERPWWGGYELSFKIIEKERQARLKNNRKMMQKGAIPVTRDQKRTFTVDLSKHEYVKGKIATELDNYTIYVYTPEMLLAEKLRAICQQMPEYEPKGKRRPRARDFYDIHAAITESQIDLTTDENRRLIRSVFSAKRVPLSLLASIDREREFHRPDWPSVVSATQGEVEGFDVYFDFVLGCVGQLETLWKEDTPF